MVVSDNNVAYIDGANLHHGIMELGWKFDYRRFRVWLREKYAVRNAYLFLGLMPKHSGLYAKLQEQGYMLIFKEVVYNRDGKAKANCDADIVVKAMQDAYEGDFAKAILVSSDGDYAPLIKFLSEKEKLEGILSPYPTKKCSILLKRTGAKIAYITDQKSALGAQQEKAPDADGTA
ncbi:MAG: hypothetical protein A3C02_01445 [Candidatus Andersenbacteria bacterium RIFCSPHIGHO2_02_FULL_45_11]|uniref:NYN domain-containing protein n=1 Tax=Candidatus Andersenbacteria bacterium RIFCSPHIGHO2_12_FULL_45_11 TaxID=1797281 RepID=A0A1G1X310_9BACT|nr:MAG: hypothetical protein A2805_01245 [Candidatus Andersenbacteria bacterium RIFCSPHIGHO2_01_FULL_46_36]OGY34389.1 MAG: hypothetical protein A3D99_02655 [Candidatus Andersenbacteria bacterium RIFCSPHIGHO2_12_FULL_45_11]OGY34967.1 MAG: hypothetical protein A3C02_01445 [Candidatus Andersenbacteria bacterium RIFCSPHIGHO2_02_FULL_45_11]